MDLKYFLDRICDVKIIDYVSIIPMFIALIIKPFYKQKYNGTWLICEEPAEARDNGYYFFQYMCKEQPQQKCYYAIKKNSVDYKKVKELGTVIEHNSIQHWLAYFLCEYNISSQKGGKPNAAVCSFMELNRIFRPKNIFLQHGVTINNVKWLYANKCCIHKFITSTYPETEYIRKNFGYSDSTIQMTGMPRFDMLHNEKTMPGRILIIPTWRYWFNLKSKQNIDIDKDFDTSEYLQCWLNLLESSKMKCLITKYNLEVIFYLHRNMQNHIEKFYKVKNKVIIASWKDYDIQDLLKTSKMLITDYSSVFFDMIYMKKPVIFYQFDEKKYRKYQYSAGYFDYQKNVFGNTYYTHEEVLDELQNIIYKDFQPEEDFLKEHDKIFGFWDTQNSKRVYEMLKFGK